MAQKEENKIDTIITLVDEVKTGIKNIKIPLAPQIDLSEIEALAQRMESGVSATAECTAELNAILEQVKKPVQIEKRYVVDLRSGKTQIVVFVLIGALLCCGLIIKNQRQTITNYQDNDIKYRYIKMKSEATPQRLSELEELFEINRDNAKIKQLRKDVEEFERAVKEKAALEEQTRLRQLEAEKLKIQVEILKSK